MGLSSFWSQLTMRPEARIKEITPQKPTRFSFDQERPTTATGVRTAQRYHTEPAAVHSGVTLSDKPREVEQKKLRRRSRGVSLSKQKSEGDLKKRRRSLFGGRSQPDDSVPAVPTLPPLSHMVLQQQQDVLAEDLIRPGTALTTDEPITWSRPTTPDVDKRKSKRMSFARALTRKRSQSAASQTSSNKRMSLFGGFRPIDQDAPPIPSMPATQLINPETGKTPAGEEQEKKSRRRSLARPFNRSRSKSDVSVKSNKSRRSWLQSSNPDDEDMESPPLPPMPQLIQDDGSATPMSMANTGSPDSSHLIDATVFADGPVRTVIRDGSIKHPRPVSGVALTAKRASYVPKNAASGFLKSTTSRPGPTRSLSSHRHSLLDDGEGGMICLSEEQQHEWEKLKNLMEVMDKRQDNGVIAMLRELEDDEDKSNGQMFSNAQALAALEFGVAR